MTELRRGAAALVLILVLPFMINGCAGKHGARGQEDGLELTILHTNDTHSRVAGFDEKGNACLSDENCTGGSGRIAARRRRTTMSSPWTPVISSRVRSFLRSTSGPCSPKLTRTFPTTP